MKPNASKRQLFILSDGTGITAETLADSLITQFEHTQFDKITIPYMDSVEKTQKVVLRINQACESEGVQPLVFMTLVNPELRKLVNQSKACLFDLFSTFIGPLEDELHEKSSYTVGKTHGVPDDAAYNHRIDAVDFAMYHDDGVKTRGYDRADIILVGVSRCGKTPSCLYMALQYGILAANYPFTEEDMLDFHLPDALKPHKAKLFGLTIAPARLQQIRSERRPDSRYASIDQCRMEVNEVEALYRRENIPFLDSTRFSIEEIATKIIDSAGLQRKVY